MSGVALSMKIMHPERDVMEGGFPYGDIIVIGAIAAFIILRYRAMLGEPRGRDPRTPPPMAQQPTNPLERVVQLPVSRAAASQEKKPEEKPFAAYETLAETFVSMRGIDRDFSPDEFMTGAKAAFEMVLTAFTKRDRETLKMLLSPALYDQFDRAIKDEEQARRYTDTTLVAIVSATLKDAALSDHQATLTVDFVSDQVHLIRDDKGTILEGNASAQNRVEDRWVFTRDLRASSPNWLIIET